LSQTFLTAAPFRLVQVSRRPQGRFRQSREAEIVIGAAAGYTASPDPAYAPQ
jgi:hypothetical protein